MKTFLNLLFLVLSTSWLTASGQADVKNLYPPINIKDWDKTPCVNGRLATKEETTNGKALLYYSKEEGAKHYKMKLPALAYMTYPEIDNDNTPKKAEELVVVIQIVKTAKDTAVAYRPLTGGNGASVFRYFRFLGKDEIKKLTAE